MKLINLTPHKITVFLLNDVHNREKIEIQPEKMPARRYVRVKISEYIFIGSHAIPIYETFFGEVENLPDPKPDTYYIVSRAVAEACPNRTDLIFPDNTVLDNEGCIIGCFGFGRISV
jgi:hypothetical protein